MFNLNDLIKTGAVLALVTIVSSDIKPMGAGAKETKAPAATSSGAPAKTEAKTEAKAEVKALTTREKIAEAFVSQNYATLQQDLRDMHAGPSADLAIDLCAEYALSHLDPVALYMLVFFNSEVYRDRASLGTPAIALTLRMMLLHLFSMLGDIGCSLARGEAKSAMSTAYENFRDSYRHWTATYFLRSEYARGVCTFSKTLAEINTLKTAIDTEMESKKVGWRSPSWIAYSSKPTTRGLMGYATNHEIYFTLLPKEKFFSSSAIVRQDAAIRALCWTEAVRRVAECPSFEAFFNLGLQDLIPDVLTGIADRTLLAGELEKLKVSDGLHE